MSDTTRLVTAEELEHMPDDDYRYDLLRGRLIRMSPVSPRHGDVTMALGALLWQHVKAHKLGRVWTEVGFKLASDPDTVLGPDVAFVRGDRLPSPDARGFYRGAPDLAVEIRSPDDRPGEVEEKMDEYLAAGTPLLVVIDPKKKRATIHRRNAVAVTITANDTLDLGEIVSGFSCPLAQIFE